MTKDLAVLKVGELRTESRLNEEIRSMKIGVVMGYEYDEATDKWYQLVGEEKQYATGVMRPLLNSTVGSIDEDMETLYLGQVMGFDIMKDTAGNTLDKDGAVIPLDEDGKLTKEPGFYKDLDHNGLYDKKEGDDDEQFDTKPSELMAAFVGMRLSDIDNDDIFSERINNVRVGDAMGYVEEDGQWYEKKKDEDGNLVYEDGKVVMVPVKGMFQSLASSKVNELEGAVQELTLDAALGYKKVDGKWMKDGKEAPGIFRILMEKGSTLTNLSEKAEEVYLGEIMGYTKTDDVDEEGNPIFKRGSESASGVVASFVGLTVKQLESDDAIKGKIDTMAVGTAMGYTYDKDTGTWYTKKKDAQGNILKDEDNNPILIPATGFMKLIDPGTKIKDLGDSKVEEKSIKDFVDAGILELDITSLDTVMGGDGWETKTDLKTFVNTLVSKVKNLPSTGS